jgi:hypothetical protein
MDGREWRGSGIGRQAASDVFSKSRGGPGGTVHGDGEGSEPETRLGAGKAVIGEGNWRPCSVVFLSSKTALEEPFGMAEGG